MKTRILRYLACPECSGDLICVDSAAVEIIDGKLACTVCASTYPVLNGIPRFVRDSVDCDQDSFTGSRFSQSWHKFDRIHEIYKQQFFDWLAPVSAEFVQGKIVLDAGCGKGRHSRIVAECGAAEVFAMDISSAVNVAARNLCHLDNAHVIQGDIKKLPFKKCFDFAYSTGVLHHMLEPRTGFRSIVSRLKDDGAISVWLYGKENNGWITSLVTPLRVAFTARMSEPVLSAVSYVLALIVLAYARLVAYPSSRVRSRFTFLPPVFYETYLAYISRFDLEEIHHIVFDHLVTPVAYYLGRGEIEQWFAEHDFAASSFRWHNQNSWSCFGSFDRECGQETVEPVVAQPRLVVSTV